MKEGTPPETSMADVSESFHQDFLIVPPQHRF
jgi:hypothetical protein